jgi:outer membrane protein OmpA-like peptidoglycan-associated protein
MKIVSTVLLSLAMSFGVSAQDTNMEKEKNPLKSYSAGIRVVHLYDLPSYRFDTDLSRDMKGLNGDKTNFDLGFDLYVEKQFTPLLGLQLGFRYGQITGANEVEYYENTFTQVNMDMILILSNLDAFHTNSKWNYYTKLGLGTGSFKAEQFLIADDTPEDLVDDNFWEGHLGVGIQYELNSQWRLELESNYTVAFTDGFDGFNNASGSDTYLATGIGIAYTFGNKDKKATYAVNYFGQDYLNLAAVKDEPHVVLPEPEVKEEDLEKIEEVIEAQQKQINKTNQTLQNQQIKIDQLERKIRTETSVQVYFNFDSSVLTREAKKELARKLEAQDKKESQKLEVVAYADNNGDSNYNEQLKQRRAESVKRFLVELGYAAGNVTMNTSTTEKKTKDNQFLNRKAEVKF